MQFSQRNVFRPDHVACGKFGGFTHVDHHGFFAVDQLDGFVGTQAGCDRALDDGGQQQRARKQGQRDQHPVIDNKFH